MVHIPDSRIRIWLWLWTCASRSTIRLGQFLVAVGCERYNSKMMIRSTKLRSRSTNSYIPRYVPRPNLSGAPRPSSGARSSARQVFPKECSPARHANPRSSRNLSTNVAARLRPLTSPPPATFQYHRGGQWCSHSRWIISLRPFPRDDAPIF
jgi:hypothetical protein